MKKSDLETPFFQYLRDYSLSASAKFSKKLTFLTGTEVKILKESFGKFCVRFKWSLSLLLVSLAEQPTQFFIGSFYSFRDPNLWMVRCRMGEEKQVVFALMRKFLTLENSETVSKFCRTERKNFLLCVSISPYVSVSLFSFLSHSLFLSLFFSDSRYTILI